MISKAYKSSSSQARGQEQESEAGGSRTAKSGMPASLEPNDIARLQRTIGNQAVMQMMRNAAAKASSTTEGAVQRKTNLTGMPDGLKEGLEASSGIDLSDVRVHYNSNKPGQLQARAYAQGSEIHLGPGQEKHLPHEGWHVVQQRQGRVSPTRLKNGQAINEDPALEQEADQLGSRSLNAQIHADRQLLVEGASGNVMAEGSSPIQMLKVTEDDIGDEFSIETNDGRKTNGILRSINGGGWYTFELLGSGEMALVRGADKILQRVDDASDSDDDSNAMDEDGYSMDVEDDVSSSDTEDSRMSIQDIEPLDPGLKEFDLGAIARERGISRREALRLVRDSFHEQPRTIRLNFPSIGMKTVSRGRPAYANPEETEKGPQAMVSYRQKDYSKHRKVGKDYDHWANELSDDEESETEKEERAQKINDYLDTNDDVDFSDLSTRQKVALGGFLSVSHISDPLRTDVHGESTERDIQEQLKARERGETGFRDIFGSKSSATFLPARSAGSSLQRELIREVRAVKLLWANNCLINAICQAVHGRNADEAELVSIRAQTGGLGEMLAASERTIRIICNVLDIDSSITVHYPTRTGLENETFGNSDDEIDIYHTGGDHFTDQCPNPKDYYWD